MALERRQQILLGLVALGAVLVVVALVATLQEWGSLDAVLLVAALLLVVLLVVTVFVSRESPIPAPEEAFGAPGPSEPAPWEPSAGAATPAAGSRKRKLTLKCKDCGTTFGLVDDGTRPLPYACPGCGKTGTIRG
ncbi:MAG: hypothetical protein ACT4PT_09525 [Methanobacteriota archaeon]